MKRNGPMITLLAGLAVAAVLLALNATAPSSPTRNRAGDADAGGVGTATLSATPPVSAPSNAAPSAAAPTAGAPAAAPATYAGSTNGGAASIAIAVHGGTAVAYLCDGNRTEAWLQGSAAAGQLNLTGARNARLTGTYDAAAANGVVVAAGREWTFTVAQVKPPSGLYRASADVRGAQVVGGWIVVNGRQVGITTVDGEPGAASSLDPATGQTTINGEPVVAKPVDGSGF